MKIIFFPNGNTMVFDETGNQIPEFQKSWLLLFINFLKRNGIDPLKIENITMPDQQSVKIIKTSNGYNWIFE